MGQEILYCFKCQERVTSADLDSANALRFGNRTACRNCVPDLLAVLSPQEQKELVARMQLPQKAGTARFTSTATPRSKAIEMPQTNRSNPVVLGAIGGVGAALVVGIVIALSVSGGPSRPPETPPAPPRAAEESPRDRSAREAKALAKEFAAVEERARVALQKEDFGSALAIYEAARDVHPGPEWKGLVDSKVDDVRKAVDALYGSLKDQATAAKRKGAENDVKSIRERIAKWGLAEKVADLESRLRSAPPPPQPAAQRPPQPSPSPQSTARPWVPIFDGKSLDFLSMGGENAWIVENGSMVHVKDRKATAQTHRLFTDGEIRIRFKVRQLTFAGFGIRQSESGSYLVGLDRKTLDLLDDKEHEVLLTFKGPEVTATLDGKPHPVSAKGKSLKGALQINGIGESFVVKTVEFREAPEHPSLVGHWTFEAAPNGNANDLSGSVNDAKLLEGAVTGPGRIGNAVHFDGKKAHVSVPSSPSLIITGPMTIAAWVNPGPPPREGYAPSIVEKWDAVGRGFLSGYFLRVSSAGLAHFLVSDGTAMAEVFSRTPLPANTWTFVAAVYDKGTVKIYINGVLESTAPASISPGASKTPLRIGMGGGGGGHNLLGALDDVRIYGQAIPEEEIARLAAR